MMFRCLTRPFKTWIISIHLDQRATSCACASRVSNSTSQDTSSGLTSYRIHNNTVIHKGNGDSCFERVAYLGPPTTVQELCIGGHPKLGHAHHLPHPLHLVYCLCHLTLLLTCPLIWNGAWRYDHGVSQRTNTKLWPQPRQMRNWGDRRWKGGTGAKPAPFYSGFPTHREKDETSSGSTRLSFVRKQMCAS